MKPLPARAGIVYPHWKRRICHAVRTEVERVARGRFKIREGLCPWYACTTAALLDSLLPGFYAAVSGAADWPIANEREDGGTCFGYGGVGIDEYSFHSWVLGLTPNGVVEIIDFSMHDTYAFAKGHGYVISHGPRVLWEPYQSITNRAFYSWDIELTRRIGYEWMLPLSGVTVDGAPQSLTELCGRIAFDVNRRIGPFQRAEPFWNQPDAVSILREHCANRNHRRDRVTETIK